MCSHWLYTSYDNEATPKQVNWLAMCSHWLYTSYDNEATPKQVN